MNPDQVLLVRASWPEAAARADTLTTTFYEYLFEIDTTAAALFAGVDMAAQKKKLAQALAVVVNAADDPGRLIPALTALGRRHAGYRVDQRHFDSVGTALLRALADTLSGAFTADVRDAWAAAYGAVAGIMRDAMAQGVREDLAASGVRPERWAPASWLERLTHADSPGPTWVAPNEVTDRGGRVIVCETVPPKDTFLTSQKCFKMQLGWNQMEWPIFTNQQKL